MNTQRPQPKTPARTPSVIAVRALGNLLYPGLFYQNDQRQQKMAQQKPLPFRPFGIFGKGPSQR